MRATTTKKKGAEGVDEHNSAPNHAYVCKIYVSHDVPNLTFPLIMDFLHARTRPRQLNPFPSGPFYPLHHSTDLLEHVSQHSSIQTRKAPIVVFLRPKAEKTLDRFQRNFGLRIWVKGGVRASASSSARARASAKANPEPKGPFQSM